MRALRLFVELEERYEPSRPEASCPARDQRTSSPSSLVSRPLKRCVNLQTRQSRKTPLRSNADAASGVAVLAHVNERGHPETLVCSHPGNTNAVRSWVHSPRLIQGAGGRAQGRARVMSRSGGTATESSARRAPEALSVGRRPSVYRDLMTPPPTRPLGHIRLVLTSATSVRSCDATSNRCGLPVGKRKPQLRPALSTHEGPSRSSGVAHLTARRRDARRLTSSPRSSALRRAHCRLGRALVRPQSRGRAYPASGAGRDVSEPQARGQA